MCVSVCHRAEPADDELLEVRHAFIWREQKRTEEPPASGTLRKMQLAEWVGGGDLLQPPGGTERQRERRREIQGDRESGKGAHRTGTRRQNKRAWRSA